MDVETGFSFARWLAELLGPGGFIAAMWAIVATVGLWWQFRECRTERKEWLQSIREIEEKRRADGISQFAEVDKFIDKMGDAYEGVAEMLNKLRIAFASRGIKEDV